MGANCCKCSRSDRSTKYEFDDVAVNSGTKSKNTNSKNKQIPKKKEAAAVTANGGNTSGNNSNGGNRPNATVKSKPEHAVNITKPTQQEPPQIASPDTPVVAGAAATPEVIEVVLNPEDPKTTTTTNTATANTAANTAAPAATATTGDNNLLKTDDGRGVTRTRSGRRVKPPQQF